MGKEMNYFRSVFFQALYGKRLGTRASVFSGDTLRYELKCRNIFVLRFHHLLNLLVKEFFRVMDDMNALDESNVHDVPFIC